MRIGIGRHPRAVKALRDAGLYVPFRLLRDGLEPLERRRFAELRRYRRTVGRVASGVSRDGLPPRGRVLFPHLSPGLLRTRIDGMLAKALEARGCEPVFVTHRDEIWHEEYLRALGFRNFVFVDDRLREAAPSERLAAELLAGARTQEDVLALRVGHAEVGRHAGSRVLKDLRRGSLALGDSELRRRLQGSLARSIRYAHAAEAILDELAPEILVTSEKGYSPWAEFYDSALRRGIDTIHWYRSHLEHSLLFRRFSWADRHAHFFTLADETWKELLAAAWSAEEGDAFVAELRESYLQGTWFERKQTLRGKRVKSAAEIRAELRLDPAKPTAFVFSHVLYDATFWFGENLFPDYAVWLVETIRAAVANPAVNWVIKMHPENVLKAQNQTGRYELEQLEEYHLVTSSFPELPDHVRLMLPENDTNTVSLFDFADYALTVRGTVGLEFPCFGVPTFTAGTGGYSGRGFTIDSKTPGEYRSRLASIQDTPRLDDATTQRARRFSHGVFQLKPVPMTSFTWTRQPEQEGDLLGPYDFALTVRDADELRHAPDLELFARWVLESRRQDLIATGAGTLVREWETLEDVFEAGADDEGALEG